MRMPGSVVGPSVATGNTRIGRKGEVMGSLKAIREHEVPSGHVALWWLGQLGYILKSPGGQVVAIDPYLTNSCAEGARRAGLNVDRLIPPPIQPGEMDVDVIAFTH